MQRPRSLLGQACPGRPSHEGRGRGTRSLGCGGEYEVICYARHSETEEALVVYRQLHPDTGFWVRPKTMFFEDVEHEGIVQPRFRKIIAPE